MLHGLHIQSIASTYLVPVNLRSMLCSRDKHAGPAADTQDKDSLGPKLPSHSDVNVSNNIRWIVGRPFEQWKLRSTIDFTHMSTACFGN